MKVYEISYGDGECNNVLAVFSTRPRAEEYLKYFEDIDEQSWDGGLPDICEIEIDNYDRPYFVREFQIDRDGKIEWFTSHINISTKRACDRLLFESEAEMDTTDLIYKTATIDREDAELEALAAWMVIIIEGRWKLKTFDDCLKDDSFPDDSWMADLHDI